LVQYDGSQLSRLRTFATSTFAEVMIITLDSFNKSSNVIFKPSEKLPGERMPFQFLQETRPILILDEPQNMESDLAKQALRTLHPLVAFRYSATHRSSPNPVYRLTPFDAYQHNLVKKIQVYGVTERENFNQPFLSLQSITTQGGIKATVRTYVTDHGRTRESSVILRQADDLQAKTGRDEHKGGYRVAEINAADDFVLFENGIRLGLRDTIGPSRVEIFRAQIEKTIEQHMDMQAQMRPKGVKVLSLFFIDRVANYVDDNGLIKRLFDAAFNKIKRRFPESEHLKPEQVRQAYFAKSKAKSGEEVAVDTALDEENKTKAQREAERAAYELIMREKEQLLSFEEPVCFIFAHSALKEGWDNPNVFQICTLNQTVSEIKKRQEIGRGLRLCVDQDGERLFGDEVNVLTVVANESYKDYAARLQQEYVETGDAQPPAPTDAKKKAAVRNERIFQRSRDFKEFWQKLTKRITYELRIDTTKLIEPCVERLNNQTFPSAVIVVEKGAFVVTSFRLTLEAVSGKKAKIQVSIETTEGDSSTSSRQYQAGDDLAHIHKDDRLKPYRLVDVISTGRNPRIVFANGVELAVGQSNIFETEAGQRPIERTTLAPEERYPVFNLIDRAARETGLTRPTLNAVFKQLSKAKKQLLFKNPEGFAGVFITEVRNALADHIAERIVFHVGGDALEYDLEELFPPSKVFPQKELIEADDHGLYDQVQIDSDVERSFVEQRLKSDEHVVLYFKFPPSFKVPLPKLIGNYNPDWGIVRRDDGGRMTLHLVRETKGTTNLAHLQFPHERRKIVCAKKYFGASGIDYRPITADTADWWRPVAGTQDILGM